MPFLTQGKTNWKYILIVLILAVIVGGGILGWVKKQEFPLTGLPEIKKPEKIVEEELCFKGELEGPIVKEITDESLRKSIIQVLIEEAENYGSGKEEVCKAQRYSISGMKIHLNEDEIPEYIIFPECINIDKDFNCIRTAISPVAGPIGGYNGPIFVFGFLQEKWKLIGNFEGNCVNEIKSRRTKGYLNLVIHSPSGYIYEYAWNGEKYELLKTTEYSLGRHITPPEEYFELWEGEGCRCGKDICEIKSSVEVLYPNEFVIWYEGESYEIKWEIKDWLNEDIKGGLHLYLLACNDLECKDEKVHFIKGSIDPRLGSYYWRVHPVDGNGITITRTNYYKIFLRNSLSIAIAVPEIKDESDNCFEIKWK